MSCRRPTIIPPSCDNCTHGPSNNYFLRHQSPPNHITSPIQWSVHNTCPIWPFPHLLFPTPTIAQSHHITNPVICTQHLPHLARPTFTFSHTNHHPITSQHQSTALYTTPAPMCPVSPLFFPTPITTQLSPNHITSSIQWSVRNTYPDLPHPNLLFYYRPLSPTPTRCY